MQRAARTGLVIGTALVLSLAACGSSEPKGAGPGATTPPATTTATGTGTGPSVSIVKPAQGSTVAAGAVTVEAYVTGFSVVDKLGQAPVPGEGHVHFYLDQTPLPTTPGQPAITSQGTYHATATLTYAWPDVKAGSHIFSVQLVNNNHTPLQPPVTATVTVTVS